MYKIMTSPTENIINNILKNDTIIVPSLEDVGADILLHTKNAFFYFQRKEVPVDFILSIGDGRMTRATSLLKTKQLEEGVIVRMILEGEFKYYHDGTLYLPNNIKSRWRREQIEGMLLDIEFIKGIPIIWTKDAEDTCKYIHRLGEWADRTKHMGLYTRPSAKGAWFEPTDVELHLWLLQSFPGIGPKIASDILDMFKGLPMRWTCTHEELMKVKRVSKKKVEAMYNALNNQKNEEVVIEETSFAQLAEMMMSINKDV